MNATCRHDTTWFLKRCLSLCALLLAACGGGGGATFGGGIGGTGKPVVKLGTVTAINSITIGGQTFDTTNADVTISGMAASATDVRVGMVALLKGTDDGGALTADSIVIEEVVKGILEVKVDANTLTVQGQTVQLDETTVFGPGIIPASAAGLTVGDPLEIYGFVRSSGVVTAARVERETVLSEFRLIGFAANVNPAMQTFSIGTQAIDYSGADTSDLPGGVPVNGQLLEARGLNMLSGIGEFLATEVKTEDLDDENDNDDTEVEGFITAINSPTQFVVSGVTINTNGGTQYESGVAADVLVGAKVDVEGSLISGALLAESVEFEDAVRIESDVATVVGSTITLVGLPGLSVTVNGLTEYDGDAASIGDVVVGDHLRIRGRATGATTVTATSVKETSTDSTVELQGPVDAVPAPSDPIFSILGVVIDTTSFAFGDFRGAEETAIGRAAFFAGIPPGTVVEAKGELVLGTAVFDEVEIESNA